MNKNLTETQIINLDNLANTRNGLKFTPVFFPYTSGQIGNYFIQSCAIEEDGNSYQFVIESISEMIERDHGKGFGRGPYIISGGETRDWDFSNPSAVELRVPHAKVYKNGKIIGADHMEGKKVINVADLNNEGSSIRDFWYPIVTEKGGNMTDAYFFVDRMEDGVQVLADMGIKRHALIELNGPTWDHLRKIGKVSYDEYMSLNERLEDKQAWAKNMLRSDEGLAQLGSLVKSTDNKTFMKGMKIFNAGYPHMQEELLDMMKTKDILTTDQYNRILEYNKLKR